MSIVYHVLSVDTVVLICELWFKVGVQLASAIAISNYAANLAIFSSDQT